MTNGQKLNVLGTEYTVWIKNVDEDELLVNCAGYCDHTAHRIVVETLTDKEKDEPDLVSDYPAFQRRTLRHEIIHAFLFESGLGGDADYSGNGTHPEMMIDWFARQAPKIWAVWKEAGALD